MDEENKPVQNLPEQTPTTSNEWSLKGFYRQHKSLLSSLMLFGAAFLTALMINAFVFQPYEVEGSSMEPTLHNADRLIVSKTGKTWSRITQTDYIPSRGDIVIFNSDKLGKQLIKRVVGIPGDRVVVSQGTVTVYNQENPDGFNPDKLENLDLYKYTEGNVDQVVEAGTIYVIGDNRLPSASLDSRVFGLVSSKDIVGVLSLRMYPFDQIDRF
ncbi:signal peptidase I [Candidatus Saccharibacteria bacterium]|nr:signal peptidase I [Candidatus Saccharibacteria bacterium]MCB9821315.1 signal peptidase I [Candidatus Nomurabacteria bacterium]